MKLVENLIAFLRGNKPEAEGADGLCSVCWGHQKYDQQIREIYKDKQIDVDNHRAKYTLVRDFVINKINGIRLRIEDDNTHLCPTCGT